jgi:hypothetical protein
MGGACAVISKGGAIYGHLPGQQSLSGGGWLLRDGEIPLPGGSHRGRLTRAVTGACTMRPYVQLSIPFRSIVLLMGQPGRERLPLRQVEHQPALMAR